MTITILGSVWFSTLNQPWHFGIVLIRNSAGEEKAYIGGALGDNEQKDEERIAKMGAKFPLKQAKELITQYEPREVEQ